MSTENEQNCKIIGLTGGICSGKSTISHILESCGAVVLDADKLGHAAYLPDTSCYLKLVENFGNTIVSSDGNINRAALGAIVFSSPDKMKELQNIVWPEIRSMIESNLADRRAEGAKAVVIEAAIMIEAGWQDLVTSMWVVKVCEETAKKRLMRRNGLSEEDSLKRIHTQMSNEQRAQHADLVIDNDEGVSTEQLEELVRGKYRKLIE